MVNISFVSINRFYSTISKALSSNDICRLDHRLQRNFVSTCPNLCLESRNFDHQYSVLETPKPQTNRMMKFKGKYISSKMEDV